MRKKNVFKVSRECSRKIRIISGKFRSRSIKVENIVGLRPTINAMRETVFNWLCNVIEDAICLDCFSGTGALSIESISRNAKYVTSLEINRKLFNNIKNCLKLMRINNISVIHTDSINWLRKISCKKYNIVFIDPPFGQGLVQKTITLLENNKWLTNKSYIYIEQEVNNSTLIVPNCWVLYKKKLSKKVTYQLYYRLK